MCDMANFLHDLGFLNDAMISRFETNFGGLLYELLASIPCLTFYTAPFSGRHADNRIHTLGQRYMGSCHEKLDRCHRSMEH